MHLCEGVFCLFAGPSKGYGFVKFETQDAAANAIYSLNGCPLEGRNIVVKVAGKNVHQPYRSFPPPSAQAGGGAYMNPYAQFYGAPAYAISLLSPVEC